jgi:acyl-CoA synthetase (AMP-forming)/AMP-acid ligase II/aryl carrier-like protein
MVPLTLADLIAAHAEHAPDAIAFTAPSRIPMSYSRLRAQMEDVVEALNRMGVGRNDRVAVVLPNGPEMAAAFVAVSAAAACAPLNPAYRASEFDFYLHDLRARAVIVQKDLSSPARAAAQSLGLPIIELSLPFDQEAGTFALSSVEGSHARCGGFAQPDDVALVLHTSGTTSRPKIVPLTQANLCTSADNIRRTLTLSARDRCLNVMPLFHIHGLIGATLSSLAAGASVVCTPGFDANRFFEWVAEFGPSWYTAVPTMHQSILSQAARNPSVLSRSPLRLIRSSSSALPPQVMQQLERVFHAPVIESYGMTEASHQVCSNPLPPGERKAGSVGLPAGPEAAIMDEAGKLLPPGSIGEIVIRGPTVTGGYENHPTANESAFHNGWFRTGDQGRIDEDGYVFITGRIKEIVNRGGEKISPREIDEVLMSHPAVVQAVAFAVPHPTLGEDLAAAVVLDDNAEISEESLRDYSFKHLADFKVPSQIVFVDTIPKGPTGKIQRIGLHSRLEKYLRREYQSPSTELQELVVSIFAEVLKLEHVGVKDNFFSVGGDSIRGMQVTSRVRSQCHIELPIVTLFRKPTPEALAAEIAQCIEAAETASLDEIITRPKQLAN